MVGGYLKTGALPGVVISATASSGLTVTVDGKPAKLAVVLEDGTVVAAGRDVAAEARSVSVNSWKSLMQAKGSLRFDSAPIPRQA